MFWDRFFLDFRLILALCAENLPRFVEISPSHGMPTFDCYTSMPFYRWAEIFQGGWGGGGPPQGVSIRRPPKVCQRRARLNSNWLCPITAGQSRHSFAQFDLKCFFPYPFLSPPAWGSPEPSYKFALSVSCWPILVDFFAFRSALEK